MTDTQLAIYKAICVCLSLSPSSAGGKVRLARVNPTPTPPADPVNTDVTYFSLLPDSASQVLEEWKEEDRIPVLYRFTPYNIVLVFYGPGAEENAFLVRDRLYRDGSGSPRQILRQAYIYPVPNPAPPVMGLEEMEVQHRFRADLSIPVRVGVRSPLMDEERYRAESVETKIYRSDE